MERDSTTRADRLPADDEQSDPPMEPETLPPYQRPDMFDRGEPPYPPLVGDTPADAAERKRINAAARYPGGPIPPLEQTLDARAARLAAAQIDVPHDPNIFVGDPEAFAGVGGVARKYGMGASVGDAVDPATPWGALGYASAELLAERFAELQRNNAKLAADLEHMARSGVYAAQQRAALLVERLLRDHSGDAVILVAEPELAVGRHAIEYADADGNRIRVELRCVRLNLPSRAAVAELAGDGMGNR